MEIIDAQLHVPTTLAPWASQISGESEAVVSVDLAVAAMEAVGVDAAVTGGSAEACAVAVRRYPSKFAGVIALHHPADVGNPDEFVGGLRSTPGIVGIRLLPGHPYTGENLHLLTEGQWEPTLVAAEEHDIPVVLFIPLHLPLVKDLASKHPRLTIIIDHLGMPAPPTYPFSDHLLDTLPDLLELAAFPNIAVKFTGVPALSADAYPFENLWPKLHKVIEAFRPERLMWGSDYTRVRRSRHPRHPGGRLNYGELVNFLRYTNEVNESDKAVMFSGAARRWFRWPGAPVSGAPQSTGVSSEKS